MPRELPILNLSQVNDLANGPEDAFCTLFHAFGIFKGEVQCGREFRFRLFDEHKQIDIRPAGDQSEYPRPRVGDIIRIHRLRVNSQLRIAEIPMARNVIVWPAFQHDPKPRCVARNPSIGEQDHVRRRILESYFCSRISPLSYLFSSGLYEIYDAIAGRVESVSSDAYGHREIELSDGTARMTLRVFRKKPENHFEVDLHFKLASELEIGDLIVATAVKLAPNKRLNLSANTAQGRQLRKVEPSSILGTKITEALSLSTNQPSQAPTNGQSESQNSLRRSPRFMQPTQDDQGSQVTSPDREHSSDGAAVSVAHFNGTQVPQTEVLPPFTLYSEIKRKDYGYEFYNIVGQVRDKPHVTNDVFRNCILQIFDGSLHEHPNFYAAQVDNPLDGCLIVCIYSKQKESDTDEHYEKACSVKEGHALYLTNVRISFVDGKIRADLSANKSHNKSINVINDGTPFGRKILNLAETPQVAELRDIIAPESDDFSGSDEQYF